MIYNTLIPIFLILVALIPMVGHYHAAAVRASFDECFAKLQTELERRMFASTRWNGLR